MIDSAAINARQMSEASLMPSILMSTSFRSVEC